MMRSTYFSFALVLCILALLLAGCHREVPETTPPVTTIPIAPLEQYDRARQPVDQAKNLILSYSMAETRTVGANALPRTVTGTASYSKIGKTTMTAVVEETLRYGSYTTAYTEAYCNRTAYAVVNGCYFSSNMSASVFTARQVPAVLVTGSLYGTVTREYADNTILLTFTQPKQLESWVTTEDVTLIRATGTAILDFAGNLMQTGYHAEYRLGDVTYVLDLTVQANAPKSLDLSAKHPAHDQECVPLTSLDALKYLIQAAGDVYAAEKVSCQATETIFSDAIPLTYNQTTQLSLSGFGDTLSATAQYNVTLSDYRGEVTATTQLDRFQDGVFTSQVNNGEPKVQDWVTAKQMRRLAEDELLSGLMAVKYLADATVTDDGSTIRLELSGNDSFCADLMTTIADFLQVNLDEAAEASETQLAGGYLVISKDTGLPVEMGIHMNKIHTINTVVYELTHTLQQNLSFE